MKSRRDLSFQRDPRSAQQDQHRPDQAVSFSQETEALRDWASRTSRIRLPTATGHLPNLAFRVRQWLALAALTAKRSAAYRPNSPPAVRFAEARRNERSTSGAILRDVRGALHIFYAIDGCRE